MPGARCTRSLVCAWVTSMHTSIHSEPSEKHPTFPHAMVYGLYRALPGDRLSCHRHRQYRFRRLDASVGASGPHVFAVRFSIIRPHALARMTPPRPSHPAPNVRDDREAPLL